jgi:hypothetical protein
VIDIAKQSGLCGTINTTEGVTSHHNKKDTKHVLLAMSIVSGSAVTYTAPTKWSSLWVRVGAGRSCHSVGGALSGGVGSQVNEEVAAVDVGGAMKDQSDSAFGPTVVICKQTAK